jgi:hypothetical protein
MMNRSHLALHGRISASHGIDTSTPNLDFNT